MTQDNDGNAFSLVGEKDATDKEREINEIFTGVLCGPKSLLDEGLSTVTSDNDAREYYLTDIISIIILFAALYLSEILLIKKIYIELLDKDIYLGKFSILFSILCIALLINSLNLIDGINGLASGFSTLWLFSLSLLLNVDLNTIFFFISFIRKQIV